MLKNLKASFGLQTYDRINTTSSVIATNYNIDSLSFLSSRQLAVTFDAFDQAV